MMIVMAMMAEGYSADQSQTHLLVAFFTLSPLLSFPVLSPKSPLSVKGKKFEEVAVT